MAIKILIATGIILALIIFYLIYSHVKKFGYHVRGSQVYFVQSEEGGFELNETLIKNADANSFKILNAKYASDQNHVYLNGLVINKANPNKIQIIEVDESRIQAIYSKDDQHVFRSLTALEGVDPHSFKVLPGDYYLDAKHVSYKDSVVAEADPTRFQLVGDEEYQIWFGKDSKSVFRLGKKIPNADPATFKIIKVGTEVSGKDKNHHYNFFGEIIPK